MRILLLGKVAKKFAGYYIAKREDRLDGYASPGTKIKNTESTVAAKGSRCHAAASVSRQEQNLGGYFL